MPDVDPPMDPMHAIHLENGRFSPETETRASDLDSLIDYFYAQQPVAGLAIHFHGGLVSLKSGKRIVTELGPKYQEAGSYPVFFVWESGPLETILNNLGDIAKEPIFRNLVRKAIEFALGKLGSAIGAKGAALAAVDPDQVAKTVDAWFAAGAGPVPYIHYALLPTDSGAKAAASPDFMYRMEIQANLEADPRFKTVLEEVSNGLLPAGSYQTTKGGGARAAATTLMDPQALEAVVEVPAPGQKGLISMAKMAWAIAETVYQIVSRFLSGRDHGLYGTVVEEVLRHFYVDKIGQALFWNQMKKDTKDAFDKTPPQPGREAGGHTLLQCLKTRLAKGAQVPRITLIGHSTGAVYICNFLERANELLPPGVKFDIILLAPAVDFGLFCRTMQTFSNRIGGVRLYGMQDEIEQEDAMAQSVLGPVLARILYPHSLLYFVSGLLEDKEVDMPILGMARFFDKTDVFNAQSFRDVDWVRGFFANSPLRQAVWSVVNAGPGRNSSSRQHGDFDNDAPTVESIQHLLSHGFGS